MRNFRCEIAVALPDFRRLGPISRWKTFHRIGDTASRQPQTIVRRNGIFLTGETEPVEGAVEQYSGEIAGKGSAGAICAMQAGGKPDDQQSSGLVAKGRHGAGMIIRMKRADLIQKSGQSRTPAAVR